MKIEFAPGCFDSFEGTQEELDALMKEIREAVESGALFENSEPVDLDNLDDLDEEDRELIERGLSNLDSDTRKLN